MTSPTSCEKELTLLIAAQCPRHNCKGLSFPDYGNRNYHADPYFNDFGGYDMFRFHLFNHYPSEEQSRAMRQLLGNEKFLTPQDEDIARDTWQKLPGAQRGKYLNKLVEYKVEVFEKLDRNGVELPDTLKEMLRERQKQREEEFSFPLSQVDDEDLKMKIPWTKEVQEILDGKWSGIFHWTVP